MSPKGQTWHKLRPIIVPLFVAIMAAGSAPWWWDDIKCLFVKCDPPPPIAITAPRNNSEVNVSDMVKGTALRKPSQVWLVIQPRKIKTCWAQGPAIVTDDGKWETSIQFGEDSTDYKGEEYEVRAFVNPHSSLKPGRTQCWPEADAVSAPLYVRRR